MSNDGEAAALKSKIDMLQKLYMVLFFASLGLLVFRWTVAGGGVARLGWALTLGGAVLCRLYRSSLINKYNQLISRGGAGPLV